MEADNRKAKRDGVGSPEGDIGQFQWAYES